MSSAQRDERDYKILIALVVGNTCLDEVWVSAFISASSASHLSSHQVGNLVPPHPALAAAVVAAATAEGKEF